jgi:hypothetical protein
MAGSGVGGGGGGMPSARLLAARRGFDAVFWLVGKGGLEDCTDVLRVTVPKTKDVFEITIE